jgi:hypothetical protein
VPINVRQARHLTALKGISTDSHKSILDWDGAPQTTTVFSIEKGQEWYFKKAQHRSSGMAARHTWHRESSK